MHRGGQHTRARLGEQTVSSETGMGTGRHVGERDAQAAARRRFLENAAAVTASAERGHRRAAARALRALGIRGQSGGIGDKRTSVALLRRVLDDAGLESSHRSR